MLIALLLQAATASPADETIYYILGSMTLVCGFAVGLWRFLVRQRKKWVDEGAEKAKALQAQKENTAQMVANTEAITKLTDQFSAFTASVREELSGLGKRISRLESYTKPS